MVPGSRWRGRRRRTGADPTGRAGRSPRPLCAAVTRAFGSTDPWVAVITELLALISVV